jgi:thiol-disulfide isomerase/thioredoxin
MSEVQDQEPKPGLGKGKVIGLPVAVTVAVLAVAVASFKLQSPSLAKYANGPMEKLVVAKSPMVLPAIPFADADGKSMTAADWEGQVVVLNVWATWCGPCKTEMPTLAKLQAAYPKDEVLVAMVSVDRDSDLNLAKADIAANAPLTLFRDPGYRLAFGLTPKVEGFPTTLIIDKQGRERARLSGDADWSTPQVKAMLDQLRRES